MGKKKKKRAFAVKRRVAPGTSPGTLTADPNAPKPVLHLMIYDERSLEEINVARPDDIRVHLDKTKVLWINVDGLGDVETVRGIGEIFGLHPLALEDVLGVHQRAKSENYGNTHFVVLRMASSRDRLDTEQVSIFIGSNFVVTFQEGVEGDSFDPVRERLRAGGRTRKQGADYLAYALIDAIVDHYFPVLEHFGERIDVLEDIVITAPTRETLNQVHLMKRDLLALRKAFWPLREAVNALIRDPIPQIREETKLYLRDVHDHIVQVIDIVETYRELASGLMDVYLSSVSNRMNEVMKVLTTMATIFIPLTFVAGIYGMNFDPEVSPWNMPELKWYYGYPFALGLMVVIGGLLVGYFWRRGWIGGPAETDSSRTTESPRGAIADDPSRSVHPM